MNEHKGLERAFGIVDEVLISDLSISQLEPNMRRHAWPLLTRERHIRAASRTWP